MKKINFRISVKTMIIIAVSYFLFLMTIIAYNSANGKYITFGNQGYLLNTNNGQVYLLNNGKVEKVIIPN